MNFLSILRFAVFRWLIVIGFGIGIVYLIVDSSFIENLMPKVEEVINKNESDWSKWLQQYTKILVDPFKNKLNKEIDK